MPRFYVLILTNKPPFQRRVWEDCRYNPTGAQAPVSSSLINSSER